MAAAIPLVASGIGAIGSIIGGSKPGYTPEQQALMAGQTKAAEAQSSLANYLKTQAQGQYALSAPAYSRATSYYSTLLGGNRAAMSQAISPAVGQLNETYSGAARNLERLGIRGGEAQTALAELNRQRAGQIGGLTVGVQPGAAAALGQLGLGGIGAATTAAGQAVGAGSSAANIYANALGANVAQGNIQYGRGQAAGQDFMSVLVPYLQQKFGGGGQGGGSGSSSGWSWGGSSDPSFLGGG